MHTSPILGLALLASMVNGFPIYKRAEVIVTEDLTVVQQADGSFVTNTPSYITTIEGAAEPAAATQAPKVAAAAAAVEAPASVAAVKPSSVAPVVTSSATSSAGIVMDTQDNVAQQAASSVAAAAAVIVKPSSTSSAAPVSSTSSAPATSTSSSTSSTTSDTSSKRGLSYNTASLLDLFSPSTLSASKASWAYNWASTASGTMPSGISFIPMLWGLGDSDTSSWISTATTAIANGAPALLGFNEPDLTTAGVGADLTPAAAAAGWVKYMNPFHGKAALVSPAVTNGGSPMGLAWTTKFLAECKKLPEPCLIDHTAIHWYDSATNIEYFKSYIGDAYVAGGNRTLWLTEFAGSGTAEEQATFLKNVLPWLDASDMVAKYAYFMVEDGVLVSGEQLSSLGSVYATTA